MDPNRNTDPLAAPLHGCQETLDLDIKLKGSENADFVQENIRLFEVEKF